MNRSRTLLVVLGLVIAACSSDGETSSESDTTSAPDTEVTAPATDVDEPEPTTTEAEPPATDAPEDEPVATTDDGDGATTGSGENADDADAEGAPTTTPLVIDGPAEVRTSCASLAKGVNDFTLEGGGAVHDVRIYVPENVSADPAPVVLNWHGLGSSGPEQAAFSGYETLAESEGFIAVHATGIDDGSGSNSWELVQFDTPDRDDLAFADTLIDTVVSDWCGDPSRVYSTGMSNGGLFTSELVCNRSTKIAAAASIAGTSHAPSCDPERAVPYISFHGTADPIVPFDGDEPSTLLPPAGVDALIDDTTPAEFAEFAADNGCDPEPTRVEETAEVIRYDYTGCDDDVPMAFYEIVEGGHTWPSSPLSDALADFGFFTQDIDATADAWAFMSQFSL